MIIIDSDIIRIEVEFASWNWIKWWVRTLFKRPRPMTEEEKQAYNQVLTDHYLEPIIELLNHQTMLAEILKVESEESREKLDTVRINHGKVKE